MTYFFQAVLNAPYVAVFEMSGGVWNLSSSAFPGLTFSPSSISVSPAGDYVAVSDSSKIVFYNLSDALVKRHEEPLNGGGEQNAAAWSPSGHRFSRADGAAIKIWRRIGDVFEIEFSISVGSATNNYNFPDDDTILISSAAAPNLRMYRLSTGGGTDLVWSLSPVHFAGAAAVSVDGKYLAAVTSDSGQLLVYKRDGDAFLLVATVPGGPSSPIGVMFSGDSDSIVVAASGGMLYFYARTGDDFSLVSFGNVNAFGSSGTMVFSQDDSLLFVPQKSASYLPTVNVFERVLGHYEKAYEITTPSNAYLGSAISPPRGFSAGLKPISGHVFDADGNPVSRVVRAYHRSTGNLVAEAVSDPVTGEYGFNAYKLTPHYIVVLDDGPKNALIRDHITPAALP